MYKSKTKSIGSFAVAAVLLSILTSSLLVPNVQADTTDNITVPKDGYVTVEFVSTEALYINSVYLLAVPQPLFLFNTSITRLGTVAPRMGWGGNWGIFFKAGQVLEFLLDAQTADPKVTYRWSTDPADNTDGAHHVKKTSIDAYTWKIAWEDMPIPPGGDFNDAVMIVRIGGDRDGDGLWDTWETNGVDIDYDGTIDLPINKDPYYANPDHKDIFLEYDWMDGTDHSHKPKDAALKLVKDAFANAPVDAGGNANPDGKPGITLHLLQGNAVPHQDYVRMFNESEKKNPPAGIGSFDDVKTANFDPKRRSVFHYCLFAHALDPNPINGVWFPTGMGELNGNDLMVTFGGYHLPPPPPAPQPTLVDLDHDGIDDRNVGTVMEQAGTLMHELGHNLNLGHGGLYETYLGGWDSINYKPNYLSVMNYFFQFWGIPPTNRLDYSHEALPDLDENSLDEHLGIQGKGIHKTDDTFFYDPNGIQQQAHGTGSIDWNWNKTKEGLSGTPPTPNVKANINKDFDKNKNPVYSKLKGWDDWENVRLIFTDSKEFEDGVHETPHLEMDEETAKRLEEFYNPDLQVTKSVDLVDAIPGDTLTYTVTVENVGKGPATKVELMDIFPDSTTETRSLADIYAGDSTTETFTFAVPFPIGDLVTLTNTAIVSCENVLGQPEEDTSNNLATVSMVVHTPVLEFSKSATPFVNAGEAITYTITYENTGSGNAAGVIVTDTLPTDVYYSLALDQGAGPAPDSVTANVDGTTTLNWLIGNLLSYSGVMTIEYTARPSLLLFAGESVANDATLDFTDANGNDYPELTTSATTDMTSVPPGQDPKSLGFVRNHNELWSDEILARIQATDDRFDGADGTIPNGQLSTPEVEASLVPGGNQPKVLMMQLLTTYYNLATRQINADTLIDSSMANQLGLANVRDAVEYAMNTLKLPVNKFNRDRYSNITLVLDEINNNLSESY